LRTNLRVAALTLLAGLVAPHAFADAPSWKIVKEIPLGAPDKWDFLAFDGATNRVYVSHASEITVVDATAGSLVGRIPGFDTSHGIAIVPSLGRGYADSGNTKTVIVFDLKTLKPIATLPAAEDADAMTYDSATGRVFVMDADGTAFTAIDAKQNKTIATVPLGGKPESAVADDAGKVFANIADTQELVRIDAKALKIESRWKLPQCQSPHGLALDAQTKRLFVSCKNDTMQVVSADDGHVVGSFPIGHGTDAAAFDPVRKLAFSSNGDGTLSVIAEKGADQFEALGNVSTRKSGRTMTIDPATGRVFIVAADVDPKKTGPGGKPALVPGSVKLLVLEMGK
jgi:DNA-binding beta-propeller fold protein YncE